MAALRLYTLIILLLAHLSLAFQFQEIFSQFFSYLSPIPQFILDARHPWIDENKSYLERLPNTTEALCGINSTLRLSNGSDSTQYPVDLFHYLEIKNTRVGISRPGWGNARLRLREMLQCPAALNDVESFNVQTWISDGKFGSGNVEPSTPPADLPGLFIEALGSMPNLRKLEWNTFGNGDQEFKEAFTKANLTLPSVHHLIPAFFTDFLMALCPNVDRLRSGDSHGWRPGGNGRPEFIKSTRYLNNLTTFSMSGEWKAEYLEELLETTPNLTTLKIDGQIADQHTRFRSANNSAGNTLRKYATIISRFPSLETLHLPPSFYLGLNFDGGHGCGNAYEGSGGRSYGRSVSWRSAKTMEKAGEIVLERIPHLRKLIIGNSSPNITKNESDGGKGGEGGVNATWPWTGRMKEWIYEQWPLWDEDKEFDEEEQLRWQEMEDVDDWGEGF